MEGQRSAVEGVRLLKTPSAQKGNLEVLAYFGIQLNGHNNIYLIFNNLKYPLKGTNF